MLRKLILIGCISLLLLALKFPARALEDCSGMTGDTAAECWGKRENELKALISDSQGQQKTLTETINFFNNKIALTETQIRLNEEELKSLEASINVLEVKIDQKNQDLTRTSILFKSRLSEAYKRIYFKPLFLLLENNGFNNFLTRNKYLQSVQNNDRMLLLQLQNAKADFEEQKRIKEEKQKQIEKIKLDLSRQKITLNSQKQEKQRLLDITRNDEKRYQSLLTEARSQKSAFNRFISSLGGASILNNQTKCDGWGCYYNQRDSQWGNKFIGASDSSMAEYGCLISSMAMIAKHYGKSLTPGDIAASTNPFFGSTAYMLQGTWSVNGVTMTRTRAGSSLSTIDDELNAGRPVIVGIYGGPDHFLVIKGKEGGEYIMHDPFPEGAANVKFTSRYPLSAITYVDKVSVQ